MISKLERLRAIADDAYRNLQRYARDWRPSILDQIGLIAALNWLAGELGSSADIKVEVTAGRLPALSPESQLVMFRVAQKALSNIRKHAGASEVSIRVEPDTNNVKRPLLIMAKVFQHPSCPETWLCKGSSVF